MFVCLRYQAVAQMEERLVHFVDESAKLVTPALEHDGTARFVHHQVIELATDCLHKSQDKMISSTYFYEMTENLEKLLADVSAGAICYDINLLNI